MTKDGAHRKRLAAAHQGKPSLTLRLGAGAPAPFPLELSGHRNRPKMMISGPRKLHYDLENLYLSLGCFWERHYGEAFNIIF